MASDKAGTGPIVAVDDAIVSPPRSEPDEKGPTDVSSTEESDKPKDFPLKWKLTALACGIALSWGSSFSENTLGPLKETLKKELEITNAQVRLEVEFISECRVLTMCSVVRSHLLGHVACEYNSPNYRRIWARLLRC